MVPPETDVAVALFWAIAFSGSGSEALRKAAALDGGMAIAPDIGSQR
jgi:hypothetical protein